MFKKFCFLFLAMAVSICIGAPAANAGLVTFYDSLGTTYTGTYSSIGTGILGGYPIAWAGGFTASSSGSVTAIDLEIAKRFTDGYGYSGAFKIEVWESSGNLPTNKIYSSTEQTASAIYGFGADYNPMTALQSISVSGLNLTANHSYLLAVVASQSNSNVVWYTSTAGTTDVLYNNAAWSLYSTSAVAPAFKISGQTSPVPIPAAVWLLGSGLIGLFGVRRFRK
jgi:hypothetical protein